MGDCGYKGLEFWMLVVSITTAVFVSSTVYAVDTFVVDSDDGVTIAEANPDDSESNFEAYFFGYSFFSAIALATIITLVLRCCCSSMGDNHDRKMYMLRLTQGVKFFVLVGTVILVDYTDKMKRKKGDEYTVGLVLLVCEIVGTWIELVILRYEMHTTDKFGIFAKTLADVTIYVMVIAQIVYVTQLRFLYTAAPAALAYAAIIATSTSDLEDSQLLTTVIGLSFGVGLALGFEGLDGFKPSEDIVAVCLFLAFTALFPYLKQSYERVAIEPKYGEPHYHNPV